jgi:lysyl-tRNA synthetase class 1
VTNSGDGDWVARAADQVIAHAERMLPGRGLVCASGISPSGPIHLGNLREILVPHFVADEIRRRGLDCRHILSWDDFDRLRKVPAGVPASFAEYIGRPLTAVPDPCGEHDNWAEHFKAPLREALLELGVDVVEFSQTEMYRSGAYRSQILLAMRERARIAEVLGRYRTRKGADEPDGSQPQAPGEGYTPYRPYCAECGRDTTTVLGYDDETTVLTYRCACGHEATERLADGGSGKLVWKVDWPMRWAFEGVAFEAGGVDHSSPGSSFTVGSELVREIFGGQPPVYLPYSFVGTRDALRIIEAPLVRWLYVRRRPNQAITVAFDQEVSRLYDEWDALSARIAGGQADEFEARVYARSIGSAEKALPLTPRPLPFRTLASIVDITTGDRTQMLRILRDMTVPDPIASLDEVSPRLDRAQAWVEEHIPAEELTRVRTAPDHDLLGSLTAAQRESLRLLRDGLADNWTLPELTRLVYGVPKLQRGLPLDAPPSAELKVAQRELFALLYRLLVGHDTGPRLPTLLLSLGQDRIRHLLTA